MSESCLVRKLSHYTELGPNDRELLRRLEEDEVLHQKGAEIFREGERETRLFVVSDGWLTGSMTLPDGRRVVTRIYHPGDIIGFPDISLKESTTTLRSVESGSLCPFPRSRLDVIFRESPRLTALLFSLALREQVMFMDLLRANSRMSARERMAYLICDLRARMRITRTGPGAELRLPLSQSDIADHLGLTNVYVSRTLAALVSEGLVSRSESGLVILDEPRLIEMADYVDRHDRLDTSWFPADGTGGEVAGAAAN